MVEAAEVAAPTAEQEEDEDVLTFSTDDSDAGEPEPDTATTQPPAEPPTSATQEGPPVDEEEPAETETGAAKVESQNTRPAFQQPSCAAVDDQAAIKRRQARFGTESLPPKKPAAVGVRQGGVAKRVGNPSAQQGNAFKPQVGHIRGQGFVQQRGRGFGSVRGRGGRAGMMFNPPMGAPFGPPDPSNLAPRPPSHPPPAAIGGSQPGVQPDMMGNAFANIKSSQPGLSTGQKFQQKRKETALGAHVKSTRLAATAAPFQPRMPSAQHPAKPAFSVGVGHPGMQVAAQVAKASTWVRPAAPAQPAQQVSKFANGAHSIENKAVAKASTWINPKAKQAGGPSATAGGSTAPSNAFAAKPQTTGMVSSAGDHEADPQEEIRKLRAKLAALERGKRKADDAEMNGSGGGGGSDSGVNGKRQRHAHSTGPAGEGAPEAGTGRAKVGILDRLQFNSQRGGSGPSNGAAAPTHHGVTGNESREADRYERGHRSADTRQRRRAYADSPPRQDRRRRQPEDTGGISDNQRRRADRFAARG